MINEIEQERQIDHADPIYTPSQLHDALVPLVKARLPVLVTGQPGQGKTDIIKQVADELGYDLLITHPVVDESIDYKGFPFPYTDEKGKPKAAFIPFGDMQKLLTAKKPLVHFADDAGHAPKAVQAAYMQWILNRAINENKMSDMVTFVAATNRKEDKAGV
ncbi:MAG: ATP-binding protein, partial [Phycisphaerae bacterium]|nr:ATP-binding protein [Phycisphaerae bacterium]NIX26156.1 AAA family ATPase [Phycisphaerae bacterium]